jgi:hypothetical protein
MNTDKAFAADERGLTQMGNNDLICEHPRAFVAENS